MQPDVTYLSSLIGSRICHDLISPIGAIANGLELLDMAGGAATPEMALISDSVGHAGARIRFFRIAFGMPGEERLPRAEIVAILRDLDKGHKISTQWQVEGDSKRSEVRLAFLALLCVETTLAFGGGVEVTEHDGRWQVAARAERLRVDADLWADLTGGDRTVRITPSLVQFALLPAALATARRDLTVQLDTDTVAIRF